jgi:membrane protein
MSADEALTEETTDEEQAPDPDDPGKPGSPTDLTKPSVFYVLRKTAREFSGDQCTDLAGR